MASPKTPTDPAGETAERAVPAAERAAAADERTAAVGEPVTVPHYLLELWRGDDGNRPGPKRAADLHGIARAGIELADAKGLAAVSMRTVAAALGFTSMALYRYLDSKDELLATMIDLAYGRPPEIAPDGSADWRERMTVWAHAELQVMHQHPWVLSIPTYEPPLTPNAVAWMEAALAALDGAPMTDQQKMGCLLTVTVYVHGQAQLVADIRARRESDRERVAYQQRLSEVIDSEAMPRVAAMLAAGMLDEDNDVSEGDDDFEFGLNAILDGAATTRFDRAGDPR